MISNAVLFVTTILAVFGGFIKVPQEDVNWNKLEKVLWMPFPFKVWFMPLLEEMGNISDFAEDDSSTDSENEYVDFSSISFGEFNPHSELFREQYKESVTEEAFRITKEMFNTNEYIWVKIYNVIRTFKLMWEILQAMDRSYDRAYVRWINNITPKPPKPPKCIGPKFIRVFKTQLLTR